VNTLQRKIRRNHTHTNLAALLTYNEKAKKIKNERVMAHHTPPLRDKLGEMPLPILSTMPFIKQLFTEVEVAEESGMEWTTQVDWNGIYKR